MVYGFNLVIEVLLISRILSELANISFALEFQSRNRGSFDFKGGSLNYKITLDLFQSRNRGSFDFKLLKLAQKWNSLLMFQSRNRGSFDFKRNSQYD